jgi:alpha-L-rhamnosidase
MEAFMNSFWRFWYLTLTILLTLGLSSAYGLEEAQGPQAPSELRVEYLTNPMGVDVQKPRFSWILGHTARGQAQSALEILVSTQAGVETGDMWASGKIEASDSTQVAYGGTPLSGGSTYYWKVRYWDKDGLVSPYSQVARFDTGLFSRDDWKGKWISGKNQVRTELRLEKKLVRARAYICGLGYYELRLNGRKVGRNVLDPGWTTYDKRILYVTYDVTEYLRPGANAVAVTLGQGWYKSTMLLFQMNVELEGGE